MSDYLYCVNLVDISRAVVLGVFIVATILFYAALWTEWLSPRQSNPKRGCDGELHS